MTTKPKARKFRIKRSPSAATEAATPQPKAAADAGPVPMPEPPRPTPAPDAAMAGEVSSSAQVNGETDIEAIRREGLTGRQLRMARRVAQKHALPATSDFDAVRLLREKGIDPFQRSNMLELVVPQAGGAQHEGGPGNALAALPAQQGGAGAGRVQLPQTVPVGRETLPSTETANPMERRMREISDIQRDITARRRKKMGLLLVRLAFFVIIPTFFAGYYFYKVATPMYATDSQFLIIQNEGTGGASPFGGLLPTQFANSADSIATQGYLQSKDAMLRLDEDAGFKDHFANSSIDPIQRLTEDPTNEEAYKLYKKNIKIGYDPTEGMIRMEVIAADPQVATTFSERLLKYAEERVNSLSQAKRDSGMNDAEIGYEKAVQQRREAQQRLIELQVENGVDPEAVIAAIRTQITNYETLLIEKQLELAALLDNARPNRAKVEGAQGDVRRLEGALAQLNDRMNNATEGNNSLAQQAVSLQLAQADLVNADTNLQLAQTGLEQARTEASRQVRYLTVAVRPVPSEEPSYPRKFENTILAFLIFGGIYLMISLTASILREQVTS
ncbi:capsule biosynthesis protein [uncultured Sulfitobacter sp.]|uniref:capsule biosynthesis protein n=1 Tax=uncultured Sulfitobacter sp. TaxID=191468 RepID=UPI002604EBA9|nr:capsule biosynthesis protein [uncultured Sulfitobacter sp.]